MKKTFTILIAAIAAILMMAQPMKVVGQSLEFAPDQLTTGSTSTSYVSSETEFTKNGVTFIINNWNPKNLQIRGNQTTNSNLQSGSNFYIHNTTPMPGNITGITITYTAGSIVASKTYAMTGSAAISSQSTSNSTAGTAATSSVTWTFDGTSPYFAIGMQKGGTSGNTYCGTITITYSTTPSTVPSISGTDPDPLAYNATNGSFTYSLDAQGTTGTVTPTVPSGSWISNLIANNGTVTFDCSINPNYLARTETVTLTYTYNTDQTKTATVTVTQAKNAGGNGSENDPFTVAEAIAATPATGLSDFIYVSGTVSGIVTEYNSLYHNISYNISDDGETTSAQLEAFRGKNLNNADFTSNQDILAGDEVTIYGRLTYYNSTTYELAEGNYLVAFNRPGTYHNVTYSANPAAGGTVTMGGYASSPASVIEGGQVAISATANTGYTFSGWSVSGTGSSVADASSASTTFTMGTADATLTANFTSITTYTVTYHANGGTGNDIGDEYNAGADITVRAANTFAYADHAFTKWTTNQNGTGTEYLPGATIENIQANIDLYAQWEESNEVTYDFAFTTIGSDGWTNSYSGNHTHTYTDETIVYFDNTGKQTMTITDVPVTKAGPTRLKLNFEITGVEFQFRQWGSNAKTVELWYSTDGGDNYTTTNITSSTFSISSMSLPEGTNALKITYSNTSNQVGIVSAKVYKAAYKDITIASVQHGTITTSPSVQANPGQTVTLTATPDAGYSLSAWDVYKTGEASTKVTVENNQFTMPNYAVTVSATFAAAKTLTFSVNGVTSAQNYAQGATVTLTAPTENIPTGFDFVGWTANPANVGNSDLITSITLNDNATVYAVFGKTISITMTGDDFNNAYSDEDDYTIGGIVFAAEQVASYSSGTFQFKNGEGFLYNKDAFSNLASIVTTQNGTYRAGMTLKAGNNQKPTDGTTITASHESSTMIETYDFTGIASPYIYMENKSGYMVRYSSIVFYFNDPTAARYTRVFQNETINKALAIVGPSIIPSGSTLDMGSYTLTNELGANKLIVEDNAQLITTSAVAATVQKSITAPTEWATNNTTYYYAISSPVGNLTAVTDVANLITTGTDYDLYKYVEGTGWQNYKAHNNDFGGLQNGHAYLYAREEGATLSFSGTTQSSAVSVENLSATGSGVLAGFHLIGNPFTHDIAYTAITATNGTKSAGYYKLNNDGLWVAGSGNITSCDGIFMQVTDGTTLTISKTPAARSNNDYIQFTIANSEYEDAAYAWFDKGMGLKKINHRNDEAPMVYINQNGENFAVATMEDNTRAFNLNFKAMTTGQYTLKYNTKGEFSYIHIYDRLTGEDVDMLLEGEYTFIGSPSDNDARFIVRLGYMPNYDGDDNFAYQNGNDIIVNGEGELQIFDVMGRNIMNTTINGVQTVNVKSQGVYIFKLNEKTQKIIVR